MKPNSLGHRTFHYRWWARKRTREDAGAVGNRITASVDGVEGLDRESAAADAPGVASISQSFALIVGITFGIVVLVVGFFFQILTVQRKRSFTALRAIGVVLATSPHR